jgi:hypothetical protein
MSDEVIKVGPNIRTGDEFKPLKEFNTHFPAHVFVLDLKDDRVVIKHGQFDYANFDDRKWLGKLTFWALSQGYSIETVAAKDVEPEWKE